MDIVSTPLWEEMGEEMKDTGARCWVKGFRARVYDEPGSQSASFLFPKGDGQEWATITVDMTADWGAIRSWVMHELMEYCAAAMDYRYHPDGRDVGEARSQLCIFIFTHDQFADIIDNAVRAWCILEPQLKKYKREKGGK